MVSRLASVAQAELRIPFPKAKRQWLQLTWSHWRFLQPEFPSGFKLEHDLQTELENARGAQSEYAGS
jgi:hypothetical protein